MYDYQYRTNLQAEQCLVVALLQTTQGGTVSTGGDIFGDGESKLASITNKLEAVFLTIESKARAKQIVIKN